MHELIVANEILLILFLGFFTQFEICGICWIPAWHDCKYMELEGSYDHTLNLLTGSNF